MDKVEIFMKSNLGLGSRHRNHAPVLLSICISAGSGSVGLWFETRSWSLADSLSVLESTTGPYTVARNFALLRFLTVERSPLAMLDQRL